MPDIAYEKGSRYVNRFYNAPAQAYSRAIDDRVRVKVQGSDF